MSANQPVKCPVSASLEVVGDRWTLLVIRDLLRGRGRFSQMRSSIEGITSSVLSTRLKKLEGNGIVERRMYSDHPPRAEYVLTSKGHELGVVVGALAQWGERHAEHNLYLVDHECGHGVDVVYRCPTCERSSPRSRIRIVG